jgi:hypothetical protein
MEKSSINQQRRISNWRFASELWVPTRGAPTPRHRVYSTDTCQQQNSPCIPDWADYSRVPWFFLPEAHQRHDIAYRVPTRVSNKIRPAFRIG